MKRALAAALLLAALPALAADPPAVRVGGPRVSLNNVAMLPRPLPFPYQEQRPAAADVEAALVRAKQRGVPLIVDLGGNWCADCRILAGVLELPELKEYVARHFELVMVDVGRYERNMDVPARWGFDRLKGVPTLLVIDGDAKLVNATTADALADARALSPQMIADFLARYAN